MKIKKNHHANQKTKAIFFFFCMFHVLVFFCINFYLLYIFHVFFQVALFWKLNTFTVIVIVCKYVCFHTRLSLSWPFSCRGVKRRTWTNRRCLNTCVSLFSVWRRGWEPLCLPLYSFAISSTAPYQFFSVKRTLLFICFVYWKHFP